MLKEKRNKRNNINVHLHVEKKALGPHLTEARQAAARREGPLVHPPSLPHLAYLGPMASQRASFWKPPSSLVCGYLYFPRLISVACSHMMLRSSFLCIPPYSSILLPQLSKCWCSSCKPHTELPVPFLTSHWAVCACHLFLLPFHCLPVFYAHYSA